MVSLDDVRKQLQLTLENTTLQQAEHEKMRVELVKIVKQTADTVEYKNFK